MAAPSTVNKGAMLCNNIYICKLKATEADRFVKCHNAACKNGNFFDLVCLGLKRMPNNAKTTRLCRSCKGKTSKTSKQPTNFTSTSLESTDQDSDSDSIDDVIITKATTGTVDKFGPLAKLNNEDYTIIRDPTGWLTCDIIQAAHVPYRRKTHCLKAYNDQLFDK